MESDYSDTMDEDSVFDDYEEQEDFVFDPVVPESLTKKLYDVDYTKVSPLDIKQRQQREINDVLNILGCSFEDASTLLRHFKWNKERLIETFMENEDQVAKDAGVVLHKEPKLMVMKDFCCDICCNDEPNLATFALSCEHRYCVDCYKYYLTQKITEEGESRHITCAGDCNLIIDEKTVALLVDPPVLEKYLFN